MASNFSNSTGGKRFRTNNTNVTKAPQCYSVCSCDAVPAKKWVEFKDMIPNLEGTYNKTEDRELLGDDVASAQEEVDEEKEDQASEQESESESQQEE